MILETLFYLVAELAASTQQTGPEQPNKPWPARIISSPNWSDYRNYPAEARTNDQEGLVVFALQIDAGGRVSQCSVAESSGFSSLDFTTCQLASQMQFEPARDSNGIAIGSVFRSRVFWLLDEPRPLASSSLDADLGYDGKKLVRCVARGSGPYFQAWKSEACQNAQTYPSRLGIQDSPVNLTLSIRIDAGDGLLVEPNWPKGQLLARDFTSFKIDVDGDATDCQTEVDGSIFSNDFRSQDNCGYFLSTIWFEQPKDRDTARGNYELRITSAN